MADSATQDNDAVISIIAEAIASKTFGYSLAGNKTRSHRSLRPVACEVLIRLHERGFIVAKAPNET